MAEDDYDTEQATADASNAASETEEKAEPKAAPKGGKQFWANDPVVEGPAPAKPAGKEEPGFLQKIFGGASKKNFWENDPVAPGQDQQARPAAAATPPAGKQFWANDPVVGENGNRQDQPARSDSPYGPTTQGEQPSAVGAAVRGTLRGIIPGAASLVGMGVGAGLGTELGGPGVGTVAGGLAGGALAGSAAQRLQDEITDSIGLDSPESRGADYEAHPYITTAANLAGGGAFLAPGTLATKLSQRVLTGGVMGSVDLLNQAREKGVSNVNLGEAGIAAAAGAVLPEVRSPISRASNAINEGLGVNRALTQYEQDLQARAPDAAARQNAAAQGKPVNAAAGATEQTAGEPVSEQATSDNTTAATPPASATLPGAPAGAGVQSQRGKNAGRPNQVVEDPEAHAAEQIATQDVPSRSATSDSVGTSQEKATPVFGQRGQENYSKLDAPYGRDAEGKPLRFKAPVFGQRAEAPGQQDQLITVDNIGQGPDVAAAMSKPGQNPAPGADVNTGPSDIEGIKAQPTFPTRDISLPKQGAPEGAPFAPKGGPEAVLQDVTKGQPEEQGRLFETRRYQPPQPMNNPAQEAPVFGQRNVPERETSPQGSTPVPENVPSGNRAIPEDLSVPEFLRRNPQSPQKAGAALPARTETPAPAAPAREAPVEEAAPTSAEEAPKPQSLSGAATQGQQGYAPAQVVAAKSKLGDLWGKMTAPFNRAMNPEALPEKVASNPKLFGLNVRSSQAETNRFAAQNQRASDAMYREINKMPAAYGNDAARTFQEGALDKNNPISRIATPLYRQEAFYRDQLNKYDKDMNWQQNYLPYFMKDPLAAKDELKGWKDDGRVGQGGHFTIGDFLDAGHQLDPALMKANGKDINFPELVRRLNTSRDMFLEQNRIIDKGLDNENLSTTERTGDVKLEGITRNGAQLYAQPDIAMMWNRYFGPKYMDPTSDAFTKRAQTIKNVGTQWQLMLGAYHFLAETQEAINGDVMRAISHAAGGEFGKAGKLAGNAVAAPWRQARSSATEAMKAYNDTDGLVPQAHKELMDDLIAGGLTPERVQRYNPEENSLTNNFWSSFGKAAVQMGDTAPMKQYFSDKGTRIGRAFNEQGLAAGTGRTALETFRTFGDAMNTVSHALFNVYIPRLKLGAAWEQMNDWKIAHPTANAEQRATAARDILKSIDDRLGEMNQSTLFWNRTLQKGANLAFISPGWETGTVRGAVGGLTDLIKNPASLSIKSENYKPNAAFPLAFAITTAAVGSIYQLLKTGQLPDSPSQAFFPITGGKIKGKPEQAIMPGYLKDVYGWWKMLNKHETLPHSVADQLYDKLSLVPHAAWDVMANHDWAEHQMVNASDPIKQQLGQFFQYVHDNMMNPIALSQAEKKEKGSTLSLPERVLGIKKAPMSGAEENKAFRDRINEQEKKKTETFRKKQQQRYE